MSITPAEAAASLRLATAAEARSQTLRGYQSAAPHLILWGGIYAVGYVISQFAPREAPAAWAALSVAGSAGSVVIGHLDTRRAAPPGYWPTILALLATFLVLVVGTALIMQPSDPRQMAAFIPLLVSAGYIVLGLGVGPRLIVAGLGLAALTFVGFFAFPDWFFLWMAACGGATLIGGGVWLRRA